MDEDNTSTEATKVVETPVEDPVLSTLSDTEDESADQKPVDPVEETEEATEPEAETPPEGEQTEEETEEVETEVDPKEEARRRYEERQRVQAERRARVQEQTQDYVKEGEDEYDQRLRSMEVQQYSALIENNENQLITEFERVKANPDLQIFNPESDQFNQRIYDKAIRDYNAGYVGYDQNGNMTEIKGSLFAHLTETAELFQGAVKSGAVQQVRAAKKMQTTADTKPAATPKEVAKDNILDILKSD